MTRHKKFARALILAALILIPTIAIPPGIATSVADTASERELVEAFVRANFVWTGTATDILLGRFVWTYLLTGAKYTMKKDDTFRAKFSDGSTVRFRFIGTIVCPSGLCFEWVMGSERRPRVLNLDGGGHYVYSGQPYLGYIGLSRNGGSCADGNLDECPKAK